MRSKASSILLPFVIVVLAPPPGVERSTSKTHSNSFFQSFLLGFVRGMAGRHRAVGYRQNCMAKCCEWSAN